MEAPPAPQQQEKASPPKDPLVFVTINPLPSAAVPSKDEEDDDDVTLHVDAPHVVRKQIYLQVDTWRLLLQRLTWTCLAPEKRTDIDTLRGGTIIELIIRGVLCVKDNTVRVPSDAAIERNRFRVPAATLNQLINGLSPKKNGPLSADMFTKMNSITKLKVFCRGHCTYTAPVLLVPPPNTAALVIPPPPLPLPLPVHQPPPPSSPLPAAAAAAAAAAAVRGPSSRQSRKRTRTRELEEGASFLLSLGDEKTRSVVSSLPSLPSMQSVGSLGSMLTALKK